MRLVDVGLGGNRCMSIGGALAACCWLEVHALLFSQKCTMVARDLTLLCVCVCPVAQWRGLSSQRSGGDT